MTLIQLFTNIANAIRAKTGSNETIKAENFPTEIADITTGHLDNTEYAEANDDLDNILEGSTPTKVFPPDWSQIGYSNTPQSIIDGFNYAKDIYDNWDSSITNLTGKFRDDRLLLFMPLVDTSSSVNMQNMFTDCRNLTKIPLLDTSNVTNMKQTFQDCVLLESVPLLNTEKVNNMFYIFQGCTNLKDVPQLNTANINSSIGLSNIFQYCLNLTNESLNNILAMCINAINYTGTKTLKYIGLTQEQAETCQSLSNYQAFLDVGWTTGY